MSLALSVPAGAAIAVPASQARSAHPAAADDTVIHSPSSLLRGRQWVSPNGRTGLKFTQDGHLVVWQGNDQNVVWQASGSPGVRATFQTDGNLVVYNSNGDDVWHAQSWPPMICIPYSGCTLAVQDDGNVVLYDPARLPYWATETNH